jgi:hypothetical protein
MVSCRRRKTRRQNLTKKFFATSSGKWQSPALRSRLGELPPFPRFGSPINRNDCKAASLLLEAKLPRSSLLADKGSYRLATHRHPTHRYAGSTLKVKSCSPNILWACARIVRLGRRKLSGDGALVQFPSRRSRLACRDHLFGINMRHHHSARDP